MGCSTSIPARALEEDSDNPRQKFDECYQPENDNKPKEDINEYHQPSKPATITVGKTTRRIIDTLRQQLKMLERGEATDNTALENLEKLHEAVRQSCYNENFGNEIGDQLASIGAAQLFFNYMKFLLKENSRAADKYYETVTGLCWTTTDKSSLFCEECRKCGMLSFLAKMLKDFKDEFLYNSQKLSFKVFSAMSILHNSIRVPSNVHYIKGLDIVDIVKWYSGQHHLPMEEVLQDVWEMTFFMLLAHIIDEEDSKSLKNTKAIEGLTQYLNEAFYTENHQYNGFHADELTEALEKLARNDKNSIQIMEELGSFQKLSSFLSEGTPKEKLAVLKLISQLSFVKENKQKLCDDKMLINELRGVASDQTDIKMQEAAKLALLELDSKPKRDNAVKSTSDKQKKEKSASNKPGGKHVMISYCHQNQTDILKIKEKLESAGYNIWFDLDNMGGDIIDSMVEAVENADVFLMCMSKGYEDSQNCRGEANHAKKHLEDECIIPLLVDKAYKPRLWIDFMIGSKLYHDVTSGYNEEQHKKLTQRIGERGKNT